ncbi:MAG: DUF1565 domain-containing protein [Oligoflexia bacterium]|nr:DUF1565 domain-containing protein [Oligoflexia bacterium]
MGAGLHCALHSFRFYSVLAIFLLAFGAVSEAADRDLPFAARAAQASINYGAGSIDPTPTPSYGGGSNPPPTPAPTPLFYNLFNHDPGILQTSSQDGSSPAVAIAALDKDYLAIDNFDSYALLNHVRLKMGAFNDTVVGQHLCRSRSGWMVDAVTGAARGSANLSMCWKRNGNAVITDFTGTLTFKPKGSHRITLQTDQSGQAKLNGITGGSSVGLANIASGTCSFAPGACSHVGKTIIDVQVLYTPESISTDINGAAEAAGSEAAVLSEIVNEIADANQAFCNSAVPAWLRLVNAAQTESQGYGVDTNFLLSDFKAQNEGRLKFEEVHSLRTSHGADLNFLYVANTSYTTASCGLSSAPTSADGIAQYGNAFAVLNRKCRGQFTFAELAGHLLGLDHSWDTTANPPTAEASQATGDTRIASYARGYRGTDARAGGPYGTLMSSASGINVLPVFSTTSAAISGACGGVPLALANTADSVRALTQGNITIEGRSGTFTGSVAAAAALTAAKYRDYYYVDQNCQGDDCVDTEAELYACYEDTSRCSYKTFKYIVDAVTASIFVPGRFLDAARARWDEKPDRLTPSAFHAPTDVHYLQDTPADIGDIILVAPGTYHERIGIRESNVTLRSIAGPKLTTIDARPDPLNGNRPSRSIAFGGTPVIQIWGIRNSTVDDITGTGTPSNVSNGSAVYHPTIQGFTLAGGHSTISAGGVSCLGEAAPKIIGNIIIDNSSHSGQGGGVSFKGCGGEISGNVIARNRIDGICRALANKAGTISDPYNLSDWCNVFVGRDGDPATHEAWEQVDTNDDGIYDASEQTHVPADNDFSPQDFVDWRMSVVGKEFAPVVGVAPYQGTAPQQARLFKPAQHMTGGAGIYVSNVCAFRPKADWREGTENICPNGSVSGELLITNNVVYDNVIDRNVNQPYFDYTNVYLGSGNRGVVYEGTVRTNGVVDLANNAPAGAGILIDGLENRDLLASGDGYTSADDSTPTTPATNNLKVKLVNNTVTNNRYRGAATGITGAGVACRNLSGIQLRIMNTIASGNYVGGTTGITQNVSCPSYVTTTSNSVVIGDGVSASSSPAGLFLTDPTIEPRPSGSITALDPYNYTSESFGLLPGINAACVSGLRPSASIDKALCAPVVGGDTILAPARDIRGFGNMDLTLVSDESSYDCSNNGLEPRDIGAIERQAGAASCGSGGGGFDPPRFGGAG